VDREFRIAELTEAALPAVVGLCRVALDQPEDAAEAAEIVRRLRDTGGTEGWAPWPRRLTGFVAVASDDRIIGVVFGSISHEEASTGHVDLIAVHPDARRRGVCRQLLARAQDALAGLGAADVMLAGNPPYYAWPGIDVRYTPALCAAMALGFEHHDTAWNMTVRQLPQAATAQEARLAAAGVTVRRAGPADRAALTALALTTWSAGWAGEIGHSIGRERAGCWLAVDADGTLLAFAAYGSSRPSWFGPMGTTPAARGRGIGAVLLRRCLAEQRAAGHEVVEIGWVGPVPFYAAAVAARVERVFVRYRKRL
jgi:mycothiol synthase